MGYGTREKRKKRNAGWIRAAIGLSCCLVALLALLLALKMHPQEQENTTGQTDQSESTFQTLESTAAESTAQTQPPTETEPPQTEAPTTAPTQTQPMETTIPTVPQVSGSLTTHPLLGGNYLNVGEGYVAEVILYGAETFKGTTKDDYSLPTNNYLPEGTVDYCYSKVITNGNLSYVVLRSGQRVYLQKKNTPMAAKVQVVKQFDATLPDHNELNVVSFENTGRHTVLTLDCLWKAPFYFDMAPQSYTNPSQSSSRDFSVTSCTAKYIDITFCYATSFAGTVQIPANNPVFKSAELIRNEHDCTLRLYLKKTGAFYGWDACYNDQGQLCFQFLNPAKVTKADNECGADLTGVKIMIDVGHGGHDCGAVAKDSGGKQWEEADLNLSLAKALKEKLEAAGATVILNREGDTTLAVDTRLTMLRAEAPDFCIAIHQNSYADSSKVNGFMSYYYTPYSQLAASKICQTTKSSGVYKSSGLGWHVYFTARQTTCPIVLTENGYMSSPYDLGNMTSTEGVNAKAAALAKGIGDYFLAIQS